MTTVATDRIKSAVGGLPHDVERRMRQGAREVRERRQASRLVCLGIDFLAPTAVFALGLHVAGRFDLPLLHDPFVRALSQDSYLFTVAVAVVIIGVWLFESE